MMQVPISSMPVYVSVGPNGRGNVEIHLRSSDWNRHGHQSDLLYGNCILHAVAVHDAEVFDVHGRMLPTFVFPESALAAWWGQYELLVQRPSAIACTDWLPIRAPAPLEFLDRSHVDGATRRACQKSRSTVACFTGRLGRRDLSCGQPRDGFTVNADPMERVAASCR